MKLYGADRLEVISCGYGCCGGALHKRRGQPERNIEGRRAAKKRARQEAKTLIRSQTL